MKAHNFILSLFQITQNIIILRFSAIPYLHLSFSILNLNFWFHLDKQKAWASSEVAAMTSICDALPFVCHLIMIFRQDIILQLIDLT